MPERFSASVAGRHINCTASGDLETAIPNWVPPIEDPDKNNAANRGTRMHALMAGIMGLPLADQKNFSSALDYMINIQGLRRFKKLIEEPKRAQWLSTAPWTTADLVLYVQDELHIIDLKTGRIPVVADDNEQMLFYAATYADLAPKATGAYLHIVQPWANNIQMWFADELTIQNFMVDALEAETNILTGNLNFSPGDHCKFCPANPHTRGARGAPLCPAMMQLLYPADPRNETAMLRLLEEED
jgi:hypothetical protein